DPLRSGVRSLAGPPKAAGSQTVTATGSVGSITGSQTVTVTHGAATHLSVTGLISTTAGTLQSATVTALDAFNNTDTNYAGTVTLTSTDGQAVLGGPNTLS